MQAHGSLGATFVSFSKIHFSRTRPINARFSRSEAVLGSLSEDMIGVIGTSPPAVLCDGGAVRRISGDERDQG
jgi:hypothetical protein